MKSIVVANWKMNPATMREAKLLFEATRKAAERAKSVSVIIAAPAVYLRELRSRYKGRRVSFAAQNAHFEKAGSFTGEISMSQVRDTHAGFVIIGHAERRAMGETNADTRKKVAAALACQLTPILCVGETTRSGKGEHFIYVADQLREGFNDVLPAKVARVIVAYEPVWAIGASKPMSAGEMHEMAIFIRKTLQAKGLNAMSVRILYGGSIDETNAVDMRRNGDVNGLLVGRASTDAKKFATLIDVLNDA